MERSLKEHGIRKIAMDGHSLGRWVLIDFADVVVHLFNEEAREYYRLELLWEDAPRVDWASGVKAEAGRARRAGQ